MMLMTKRKNSYDKNKTIKMKIWLSEILYYST